MKKNKAIKGQYRQGDVLIEEIAIDSINLPEAVEEKRDQLGRIVLAYGESTGHAHTVHDGRVKIFNLNGARYLYAPEKADFILRHEVDGGMPTGDHNWITVKPSVSGLFRIGGKANGQREYSPEAIRQVID